MTIKRSFEEDRYYQLKTDNTDDKKCVLKFGSCHEKYPLWDLNKSELKNFIDYAKKVESLSWKEIKIYQGLKYENLPNINPRPDNIDNDITLSSMRLSNKFRIIGYREKEYFCIVWFDKNHVTC